MIVQNTNMNNNIHPCLWYDGNAKAAAEFYCIFPGSTIIADTPMVVKWQLVLANIYGFEWRPYVSTKRFHINDGYLR